MIVPISSDLQKSYRDTLNIPSAPQMIDTDEKIVPVAIIATATTTSTAQFMKITDGTDTLSINTDGSINAKKINPVVLANASRTSAGTTAIYTVPAGKIAKIYDVAVWCDSATPTASGDNGQITLNGVVAIQNNLVGSGSILSPGSQTTLPVAHRSFGSGYVTLTAGQIVNLVTSGGTDFTGSISYQEETI